MNVFSFRPVAFCLCINVGCILIAHSIVVAQTKTALPTDGGPYKVYGSDFTGDGLADLAVGHYWAGLLSIEKGDGRGNFSHLALTPICEGCDSSYKGGTYNIAYADVDKDGMLDFAIGCSGNFVVVAKNLGNGKLQRMQVFRTESSAKGVRWADLDNDGQIDLLYTARGTGRPGDTPSGKLSIRRGLGDWDFDNERKFEAGISAYYVETGDLNEDGYLDILIPNELGTTVSYWINPGKDIFNDRTAMPRQVLQTSGQKINDVRAADFNGDGHLDVLTANWVSSNISLFLGKGDGTFGDEHLMPGGKHCVFFAVGDFDKDNDLDFVVTHWTENFLSVFLNQGNGQFAPKTDYTTGNGNYGVDVIDADQDGNLDVVTANFRERTLALLRGKGDGTFYPAAISRKNVSRKTGEWTMQNESGFEGEE